MKTIFESVIARGGYDLTGLLGKIDSYHVMGRMDANGILIQSKSTLKM